MKKWYICENIAGIRLQIAPYKYLKVDYGRNLLDVALAEKFPDLLQEVIVEKKVLLVEEPVVVESVLESVPTIEVVEKEIKPKKKSKKKKKAGRPKKSK